ncbi:hypothetical protein, partial [Pseudomonas viridiflava]|uniref:hypothetical protein n=1 Tax=Pseudomonas viridiflava TaxID=33069 RepID=UPI0013E0853F
MSQLAQFPMMRYRRESAWTKQREDAVHLESRVSFGQPSNCGRNLSPSVGDEHFTFRRIARLRELLLQMPEALCDGRIFGDRRNVDAPHA